MTVILCHAQKKQESQKRKSQITTAFLPINTELKLMKRTRTNVWQKPNIPQRVIKVASPRLIHLVDQRNTACRNTLWFTLTEKDHLGGWSPEKDCCLWLTFRQPVRKPSSESSDSLRQLKIQKKDERFDWSIDRVAVGKCVMWLAVKTCGEI